MGDVGEPIAGVLEGRRWVVSEAAANQRAGTESESIGLERWEIAEAATTQKIISKVQPTLASEKRRRLVILYLQRLIRTYLGCEVFPYGSVPLKTYLPDGDIDLTAFVSSSLEESLANDLVSVLQAEEQNSAAEFIVKDVQLIRAEVKLVKCIVQNIVVDISFNQLGGLCTLCFLEQVNRQIGKDHLFKRSIILIKTWCYYESRILGAHHSLISTYALETLVLYIFQLFHLKLDGPLAVLHRFLDYFSKFDWDIYCVSLKGPVCISSLSEVVDKKLESGGSDILLSDEFLRYCMDMFSVPSKGVEKNLSRFSPKHLNIIDPLKGNNNLGRSVSKGNLFRIRSAFAYGARKLGQVLLHEKSNMVDELSNFFSNTLDRHGSGQRPDVQDLYGHAISAANSVSGNGVCKWDNGNDGTSLIQNAGGNNNGDKKGSSTDVANRIMILEKDGIRDVSLGDNIKDLGSSKLQFSKTTNNTSKPSTPLPSVSQPEGIRIPHFAPHLYFSGAKFNGKYSKSMSNCSQEEDVSSVSNQQVSVTVGMKDVARFEHSYSDLNGDYDIHFNNMQYGRFCYEHSLGVPATLTSPVPSLWDVNQHSYPYKQNGFPNMSANNVGMIPTPGFFTNNPLVLIPHGTTSFGVEDLSKQRGTGTYIPNANRPPYFDHLIARRRMNDQRGAMSWPHHPRYTSWTPFQKVDSSIIINGLDMKNKREKEVTVHVPESNNIRQQNPPFSQNFLPAGPEELQTLTPVLAAADEDTRLVVTKSLYRLKDEDDFPPLTM